MITTPVTRIKSKQPVPYELTAIHRDTHNTKTFCFALPDEATLDLLPGDHLYVHATIDGKQVKRYESGAMSRRLHDRQVGETVLMSGPNSGGHWWMAWRRKPGLWPVARASPH